MRRILAALGIISASRTKTPQDKRSQSPMARSGNGSAGYVRGRHFTEYVEAVKQLKRERRHEEAIALLLELVEATEAEAQAEGYGAAPWYYVQLAIIYRKDRRFDDEVAILERAQHSVGHDQAMTRRLQKARTLAVGSKR